MTNLPLILYFADVLDVLKTLLFAVISISAAGIVLAIFGKIMIVFDGDEQEKEKLPLLNKFLKYFIIPCVVATTLQIFTPSKTTLYIYAGMQTVTAVSSNPTLEKIVKVVNKKLDEMIDTKE